MVVGLVPPRHRRDALWPGGGGSRLWPLPGQCHLPFIILHLALRANVPRRSAQLSPASVVALAIAAPAIRARQPCRRANAQKGGVARVKCLENVQPFIINESWRWKMSVLLHLNDGDFGMIAGSKRRGQSIAVQRDCGEFIVPTLAHHPPMGRISLLLLDYRRSAIAVGCSKD